VPDAMVLARSSNASSSRILPRLPVFASCRSVFREARRHMKGMLMSHLDEWRRTDQRHYGWQRPLPVSRVAGRLVVCLATLWSGANPIFYAASWLATHFQRGDWFSCQRQYRWTADRDFGCNPPVFVDQDSRRCPAGPEGAGAFKASI